MSSVSERPKLCNLSEIMKRANGATSGPWAWESVGLDSNEWCLGVTSPAHDGEIVETYDESTGRFGEKPAVVEGIAQSCGEGLFQNAAFIAAARSDVPAMAAEIESWRKAALAMFEASTVDDRDAVAAALRGLSSLLPR